MSHERLNDIEQRIAATRDNLDGTLREIERRLQPEHLVGQGLDYLRHSGANEFASNLGESVKSNPLPVTFVALGMAWLMMTNKRYDRGTSRSSSALASAESGIAEGTRRAGAAAADAAHELRERASHSVDAARDVFERARGGYERVREQQPLALGAVGLAIGAAIALAVPRTRQEEEWLGEASGRVMEKARAAGREQMERVRDVAAAAGEAAVHEASRQTQSTQHRDMPDGNAPEPWPQPKASADGDVSATRRGDPPSRG